MRSAPPWVSGLCIELGNARGSGLWGEELELSFELIECETYQRIIEQAYPLGRGGTKTVSRILGCFPVQVIHWGFRPLCRGNNLTPDSTGSYY